MGNMILVFGGDVQTTVSSAVMEKIAPHNAVKIHGDGDEGRTEFKQLFHVRLWKKLHLIMLSKSMVMETRDGLKAHIPN
ncbi:hypothetical protein SLA2020_464660 [Shorea laevis]